MYPKAYLFKRIQDAKIFIDRNYCDPLDLNLVAQKVYLSKYHFLRLFKEAYGTSPHQYLISRRIAYAKKLLREGESVSHTCHQIGFESVSSFSCLFKKHVGISPSHYQKQRDVTVTDSNFR